MGNTSFILLRSAQHDGLTGPATQFAELTGAYWLEPIYAGLANEWSRQGRTVPGTPSARARLQLMTEGPERTESTESTEQPERLEEPAAERGEGAERAEASERPEPAPMNGLTGLTVLPPVNGLTGPVGLTGQTGPDDANEPAGPAR